ncbi:MAG: sigma-54-dependent Fis family transcriptional regulator [bacterium]|nr:sigma-54-dependent Fis family transcriptional regulator [bacterium]
MAAPTAVLPHLLVVEDDPAAAVLMTEMLAAIGIRPEHVSTCRDAYRALHRQDFACVVIDLSLPDGSGHDIQQTLQRRRNPPPVVFVTADDMAESAIRVMQAGALQYVVKRPEYLVRLRDAVRSAVDSVTGIEARDELATKAAQAPETQGEISTLVGSSPAMLDVRTRIQRCAGRGTTVLVTGETGTGKELVARAIHAAGPAADEPFVAVNCAAIAGTLFESELFGSVRGAFTGATRDRGGLFAAAGRGTLFLDEVGELPLDAQAKLLRVLDDRSYRRVGDPRECRTQARIVAATNRDLRAEVEEERFREDLFYRLDVMCVPVPPLRERLSDLPQLVEHFLACESEVFGPRLATAGALEGLRVHAWPGNVRELKHTVTRTLAWSDAPEIDHFDVRVGAGSEQRRAAAPPNRLRLGWSEVAQALREHRGRLSPAAQSLDLSVRTLQRRMSDLGIRARDFR